MLWNLQSYPTTVFNEKCDIFSGSKHTLTHFTYFRGPRPPILRIYAPAVNNSWNDQIKYNDLFVLKVPININQPRIETCWTWIGCYQLVVICSQNICKICLNTETDRGSIAACLSAVEEGRGPPTSLWFHWHEL